MNSIDFCLLPDVIVEKIVAFIQTKLREEHEKGRFINELIREDIFPLLDQFCTIVYYPIKDNENNGFHKKYTFRGKSIDFVYINTNQDREKQIFTAAHELGHIWKVDDYIYGNLSDIKNDYDSRERIMNRFAAELLMPKSAFIRFFDHAVKKVATNGRIPVLEIIKPITDVMNEFFVPYKAVICRLYELKILNDNGFKVLLDNQDILVELSKEYAEKQGYSRLYKPDGKKFIEGLQTALQKAKSENAFSDKWIAKFCKQFEISIDEITSSLNETVEIQEGELDGESGS